ncbi:putative DNA binding domain-containing protein [Microbacterium sp. LRZ72]|uniref:ATP-binding protein n=1 Tax=Microbacterium sp. LRZ72 TaxID=2942481 RepID=UPI0029B2A299|nr:ATP-binding protein [Microbacterium sp. LRZ72]MDX2377643.1 putative DNA binding domain-containing protein [Microbacterium sp. LRZ72]
MKNYAFSINLNLVSLIDEAIIAVLEGALPRDVESAALDFKQEAETVKRTLEVLADAVVCFANSEGGVIVLGVADSTSGSAGIVGTSPTLDASTIVRGIFDRTKPALSVPVAVREVEGRTLYEITVPAGATFYSNAKGTATRRVNDACVPFPPDEQRQALASRGVYDWSALPSGVSRYDEAELLRVRRLLRAADKTELASAEPWALLADLRLVASDGSLTNAGLLVVGDEADITEHIPTHGFSYQYRTSTGTEASFRFRGRRAILAAAEQIIEAIETRTSISPLNVSGGVQIQRQDYPPEAVRELAVNALVHRDFEAEGSVDIEQTPQSLRIVSPGGLVHGVTAQNILSHPSTPRNRLLLETVTTLQVAERTGQGIDRAYRALLRAGKKPPTFSDNGTSVEALVPGGAGNDAFIRFVRTQLPESLAVDIEALLILDTLCVQRRVAAAVVAPLIQRSVIEGQRALERLATAELVSPTRRTASAPFPNYELTSTALTGLGLAVAYHRRAEGGVEDKTVEHLREYGSITNQTLRRLFDMEMYPARDMLRELQRRGIIEKLERDARGPGVKYGPGPNFPTR